MVDRFGKQATQVIVGWLVAMIVRRYIDKDFRLNFPLQAILEAPDFDKAIRDAAEDYKRKQPGMTTNIPGFERFLNGGEK